MRRSPRLAAALVAAFFLPAAAGAQTVVAPTRNTSVVIVAGNAFQQILPAISQMSERRSLTIQNNNASDSCWLYVGGGTPTKATSILITPGASYARYYPYIPSDALSATCVTTSDTLYVDSQ